MKLLLTFLFFSTPLFASFLPKSFSVDVMQTYTSQLNGKVKSSKAKIDYQYPGKLRYKNDDLLFVTNSEKSWQFIPSMIPGEKNELIVSSKNHVIGKLFDSLKSGLKSNKIYSVKKRTDSHFQIIFTEIGKNEFRLKNVEFFAYGNNKEKSLKDIKTMVLEYMDAKKISLNFSSFQEVQKFPNNKFVFKDSNPKNTKILNQ